MILFWFFFFWMVTVVLFSLGSEGDQNEWDWPGVFQDPGKMPDPYYAGVGDQVVPGPRGGVVPGGKVGAVAVEMRGE